MRKKIIPRPTLGINITPLCDIMLALLIFFMLVSKKGLDTGADPEIELPRAFMGVNIEDIGHSVVLNIYAGGGDEPEVTTLNPSTGRHINLRIVERRADGVAEPLAEFLSIARRVNPEVQVVLYADEDLDYRYLEKVLVAAATAQVKTVSFAADRRAPDVQ
jgi:biopolymer transport protein ExbD